jgi:chitinase
MQKEDGLNLNIVRALRREGQLKAVCPTMPSNTYIKEQVTLLNNLGTSVVCLGNAGTEINSWGIHPACHQLMAAPDKKELFGE